MFVVRWHNFIASILPDDPMAGLAAKFLPRPGHSGRRTRAALGWVWLTDKGQLGAVTITFPLPFQEDSEL